MTRGQRLAMGKEKRRAKNNHLSMVGGGDFMHDRCLETEKSKEHICEHCGKPLVDFMKYTPRGRNPFFVGLIGCGNLECPSNIVHCEYCGEPMQNRKEYLAVSGCVVILHNCRNKTCREKSREERKKARMFMESNPDIYDKYPF